MKKRLKRILVFSYTKLQTTFLYNFRASGKNLRLGRHLFIYPKRVSVGDNVYIGQNCYLDGDITIGNNTMLASYVSIVGGDHRFDVPEVPIRDTGREHWNKTIIGENTWIGHGAIIMNGVTIGNGSVIGAGSIVTKDIPPNSIAFGSPATVRRSRL